MVVLIDGVAAVVLAVAVIVTVDDAVVIVVTVAVLATADADVVAAAVSAVDVAAVDGASSVDGSGYCSCCC